MPPRRQSRDVVVEDLAAKNSGESVALKPFFPPNLLAYLARFELVNQRRYARVLAKERSEPSTGI